MEFSSDRFKKLAGLLKEGAEPEEPVVTEVCVEAPTVVEDWANYKSIEQIEQKYFAKLESLLGGFDDFSLTGKQLQQIFKTALRDAHTLGSIDAIKNQD